MARILCCCPWPLSGQSLGDDAIRVNAKAIGAAMRSSDDHSRSIEAVESLLGKDSSRHVRHRRVS
jgi:hypothetical protein